MTALLKASFFIACLSICITSDARGDAQLSKTQHEDICFPTHCGDIPLGNQSQVVEFCDQSSFSEIYGRCCIRQFKNLNGTKKPKHYTHYVTGADLSSCKINENTHLYSENTTILYEKEYLQVLMLEGNNNLDCGKKTFEGMGYLDYLSLPHRCRCPGNDSAWEAVKQEKKVTVCLWEIDFCGHAFNYTCPNNQSECVMMYPGEPWCVCKQGYYGYKCLRSGDFPWIIFGSGMIGGTVIVSFFLWVTQRRHAKYD